MARTRVVKPCLFNRRTTRKNLTQQDGQYTWDSVTSKVTLIDGSFNELEQERVSVRPMEGQLTVLPTINTDYEFEPIEQGDEDDNFRRLQHVESRQDINVSEAGI